MRALLVLVSLVVASQLGAVPLPAGVTGNYYNPAQSGHGVNIEVLDAERAIVTWYVYDHDGNPMTIYVEGHIEENRIAGTAYAPRGMRFGRFDPAELQVPVWGRVELEFANCARGTLRWSSPVGFGAGSVELHRLAYTAACAGGEKLPSGTLGGFIAPPFAPAGKLSGVVMPDGALWAITPSEGNGTDIAISPATRILSGAPSASGSADRIVARVRSLPNGFLCQFSSSSCDGAASEEFEVPFVRGDAAFEARIPGDGSQLRATLNRALPWSDPLRGAFQFDGDGISPGRWQVVFGTNDEVCLRAYRTTECLYRGRVERLGAGPHAFELQGRAGEPPYRGVVITDSHQVFLGPLSLHFIGSNGETGLAFAARLDWRP